jgi:hypothetical protein
MTSTIKVDTISENTSANGVAVDGVTLKDGAVGAAGTATSVAGIPLFTADNSIYTHDVSGTDNTASFNTAYGIGALGAITDGDQSVAIGYGAGDATTTGRVLAIGKDAAGANTTGGAIIAIGDTAYDAADTENYNIAIGTDALGGAVAGGEYNVAVGHFSLDALTSGDNNVAIGYEAGTSITSSNGNVLVGYRAGENITENGYNVLVGSNAGEAITTGTRNIMLGQAGNEFDAENDNIGIGHGALGGAVAGGEYNVAVGNFALDALTSGDSNVAVGYNAGTANTTGHSNTFLGGNAGAAVTTGFSNVIIGQSAAQGNSIDLTTGDQNTLVGRNIQTTSADSNTANGLGYFLSCEGGYTTLGQSGDDIRAAHGTATWATVSDERFKKNIETSDAGLAVINDLRPVTYNWKTMGEIPEWSRWYEEGSDEQYRNSKLNHGFVAQEVKAVIDSHSELKDGFNMWYEREDGQQEVGETAIVPILVKAVQELSATVTTLQQEINTLKGE